MWLVLTILKSCSDATIIFPGFNTNFWSAIPIADIFMLLLYTGVLAPEWLRHCCQNTENGEVWMQIHLNFARIVSSIHYNAAHFTFEILSKLQFIAT